MITILRWLLFDQSLEPGAGGSFRPKKFENHWQRRIYIQRERWIREPSQGFVFSFLFSIGRFAQQTKRNDKKRSIASLRKSRFFPSVVCVCFFGCYPGVRECGFGRGFCLFLCTLPLSLFLFFLYSLPLLISLLISLSIPRINDS